LRAFDSARSGKSWWRELSYTNDATTVIVQLENGAAMAGILVAAIGLGLSQLTDDPVFRQYRVGDHRPAHRRRRPLPGPRGQGAAHRRSGGFSARPWPAPCHDPPGGGGHRLDLTIHKAPEQIVAALNVDFDNRPTAGDAERIVVEIEQAVQDEFPSVTRVYLRPNKDAGIKFGSERGRWCNFTSGNSLRVLV
jgi:hypothetical protein